MNRFLFRLPVSNLSMSPPDKRWGEPPALEEKLFQKTNYIHSHTLSVQPLEAELLYSATFLLKLG